jgi:regulator of protease activity HflC (stomatin/prohibitin superfamily)
MARPYMEGKKLPDEKYALILRVSMREEELDRARQLETDLRKEAKLAEAALEALQQEKEKLKVALSNVVNGNDLALERGYSIENWRNSDFRKQAMAALNPPRIEEKPNETNPDKAVEGLSE